MKNIYKTMYNEKNNLRLSSNPRIGRMVEMVNNSSPEKGNILDIGCYDGTFLSLINKKNNTLYGIEASKYGVEESKKKGIIVRDFLFDDSNPMPFESGFFDVIIAGEIIEHIYDTDFFLEEIIRMLKPDGKLIISTPNVASLPRRLMLLFGINPIIEVSPNEKISSGHIRYFTFSSFNYLLKKHRLKPVLKKSDVTNFSADGSVRSCLIPKIFPTLGQSIIFLCEKKL